MKVTVSHSGKQHSYHLAKALKDLGYLDRFYTSSYVSSAWLQDYFKRSGNTFFSRRFLHGLSGQDVSANWRFELKEVYLRQRYGKGPIALNAVFERDINFDNFVAGLIGRRKSDVFWGFQGSAHDSLIAAKKAGKQATVELATAHVTASKKILGEELKLHPDWADSIDYLEFPAHYEKRLEQEPHLADVVISASKFTSQTLLDDGIAPSKIQLLPLGFELDHVAYTPKDQQPDGRISKRPLRLLYAGTLTQRKGIKYALEALRMMPKGEVELHCIGGIQGSGKALEAYKGEYNFLGRISQYELFASYQNYDALILPTVFEGFGLVIVEAMAAGLPVITTAHSMGPDVINHGENGYLVPIRDINATAAAVASLRSLTDEQYWAMSAAARKSVLNFTWDVFARNLDTVVRSWQ